MPNAFKVNDGCLADRSAKFGAIGLCGISARKGQRTFGSKFPTLMIRQRHAQRYVGPRMPGASLDWQLAPLCFDCTRYRVHAFVKAWHHIPLWHGVFAGPQAHVAFVCCSV
jgi:hypothetical protein